MLANVTLIWCFNLVATHSPLCGGIESSTMMRFQPLAQHKVKEMCSTRKYSARGPNSWWLRSPTPLSAEPYPAGHSPQTGQAHRHSTKSLRFPSAPCQTQLPVYRSQIKDYGCIYTGSPILIFFH